MHFCPLPSSSLLQLHLLLLTSLPLPFLSGFWSGFEVWSVAKKHNSRVSPNQVGGGGEQSENEKERDGSHHYSLTYIHFHPADWILCWCLQPITSGGGVLVSQWRRPPFAELFYCLHTVFTDCTTAERMNEKDREGGDKTRDWKLTHRKRRQKGKEKIDGEQLRQAEIWVHLSLFALSVLYNCRQIKEG